MKLSLRGWIFTLTGIFVFFNAVSSWWVFTQAHAAWLVPVYLLVVLLVGTVMAQRLWVVIASNQASAGGFVAASDEDSKRLVYVGTDSFREGRTCGEVMAQALNGRGTVAVVTCEHGQSLMIREKGFASIFEEKYPGIKIVTHVGEPGIRDTPHFDLRLSEMFQQFPELDGVYVLDGNSPGTVIKELVRSGKARRIKLVCHDMVDTTMQGVAEGIVTCTISQDPYAQGYNPVIYLYNYLVAGQRPPRPKMTTQMIRVTQENYRQYWDPQHGVIETGVSQAYRVRPVDKRPDHPLRIIVLGIDTSVSEFYAPIQAGARAAAELLRSCNTTVEWIDPAMLRKSAAHDVTTFGAAIDEYRAKKYDAIALPVYDKHIVPHINGAVEAGIAIAVYNSEPETVNSLMASLHTQSRDLLEITMALAQSAAESGQRADQINLAISAMREALTQESESAVMAIESTRQIASAIRGIDQGAQEQTQAASYATDATQTIFEAVEGTRQASLTSQRASVQAVDTARQGGQTIQQTLGQIAAISDSVDKSAEKIRALNQFLSQIDGIVSTVNEMAEQTNMLALNANIEAARAGENGRGFAVVATEIRELAEMSKKSTKEIAALVRTLQKNSAQMVATIDDATLQAKTGSQLAKEAGQALETLLKAAETMRAQTEQVVRTNASVVQSLDQLNMANQRVSGVLVENASAIRQVTGSIQQTVERVNHMTGISKDNVQTIEDIHTLSDQVAHQSTQLKGSITSLVQMAEELQGVVVAFKLNHK